MQSYNINIIRPAAQNNLECYHKVISLTHRILTDATLDQSGPGNNGNEMVTPHKQINICTGSKIKGV